MSHQYLDIQHKIRIDIFFIGVFLMMLSLFDLIKQTSIGVGIGMVSEIESDQIPVFYPLMTPILINLSISILIMMLSKPISMVGLLAYSKLKK